MNDSAAKGIRIGVALFAGLITVFVLGFTFFAGFSILMALVFFGITRSLWRKACFKWKGRRDNVRYYVPEK